MDLLQYLRKNRGGKRVKSGVLLARKVKAKKVLVGWSKCKLTVDQFDPARGKEIAENRIDARLNGREKHDLPPSMKETVDEFVARCKRYFKVKSVEVV